MTTALASRPEWCTARARLPLDRPILFGILNTTPDSFWDGGRHAHVTAAVTRAESMFADGADVIDIGGESTRPGATPITADEECARVLPAVEAILARWPDAILSIDTTKSAVARRALDAGAAIINDVSGLRLDPALADVVAEARAGIVLMHSRGGVADMASYAHATYDDVMADVCAALERATHVAERAGVDGNSIVVDPGLGFSKRTEHSIATLAGLDRLVALGYPVLVGPSRKRFVGDVAGGLSPDLRLEGTIAACCVAWAAGARLFRVHDVAPVARALAVAAAVTLATGEVR